MKSFNNIDREIIHIGMEPLCIPDMPIIYLVLFANNQGEIGKREFPYLRKS